MGKLSLFFLSLLSFNNPGAIVINLSSILIALTIIPSKYIEYSPFKCVFKNLLLPLIFGGVCPTTGFFTNCNCPACGMTRGMSRLLHGDWRGALNYNRMVIVVFVVMVILIMVNIITLIRRKDYK